VIEERHGFNKQTLRLFFTDLLKTAALSAIIGAAARSKQAKPRADRVRVQACP